MSQIQNFDFLPSVSSITIPESGTAKREFFSEEDAAAWAKEAEAAGIQPRQNEEKSQDSQDDTESNAIASSASSVETEVQAKPESDKAPITDLVSEETPLNTVSTGTAFGDDLWSLQVSNTLAANDEVKQETAKAEIMATPQTAEAELSQVESNSIKEIKAATNEDEVAELEFQAEDIETEIDLELTSEPAAEDSAETGTEADTYSFKSNGSGNGANNNLNTEASDTVENKAKLAESDLDSGGEFEFGSDDEFDDDFWTIERAETSEGADFEIDIPSNDNLETNYAQSTGARAAGASQSVKGLGSMSASFSALQARAEALAAQNSFTLKGADFGGDMDIRMRSTMKGLDLTLLPQLATQAAQLNGSLKTIKDMLKERGVHTHSVRLNDLNVEDLPTERTARILDTAFFSNPHGINDNTVIEPSEVRRRAFTVVDSGREGDNA